MYCMLCYITVVMHRSNDTNNVAGSSSAKRAIGSSRIESIGDVHVGPRLRSREIINYGQFVACSAPSNLTTEAVNYGCEPHQVGGTQRQHNGGAHRQGDCLRVPLGS